MKQKRLLILLTLGSLSAFSAYAQDPLIKTKTKGGVTIVKDKTKPIRREIEAVFEQRVQAVKNRDAEAQIAMTSPDYSATLPNGQTLNYEQLKNYFRLGANQFVEIGDLKITAESITVKGNEAIVEARQYFPRKQRLRDGRIHDVLTTVLQTETWVKTADGWKLKRVEDEREGIFVVDGKSHDPQKPYNPNDPPFIPNKR